MILHRLLVSGSTNDVASQANHHVYLCLGNAIVFILLTVFDTRLYFYRMPKVVGIPGPRPFFSLW
jgi:hypothetical protein